MKIQHIKINNFKGIDNIETALKGNSVFLVGGNAKNKSSFIDAIFTTLTGKNKPSKAVRGSADSGLVEMDLGSHKVKCAYNKAGKMVLTVTDPTGNAKYSSPRTLLNDLVGIIDFDPTDFLKLQPKQMEEYICKLAGLDLRNEDTVIADAVEKRKAMKRELSAIPVAELPGQKPEKVVVADLFEKLEEAREFNLDIRNTEQRLTEHNLKVTDTKKAISDINARVEALLKEAEDKAKELEQARQSASALESYLSDVEEIDTAPIKEKIDSSEAANREHAEWMRINRQNEDNALLEQRIAEVDTEIDTFQLGKKTKIEQALDIPGLEYRDGGFFVDGLPFERNQLNSATEIITGLRMGLKLIKDVRIMRLEGSLIDNKNMKDITSWASENDIQLFIEQVDREGGDMQIIIEEKPEEGWIQ